MDITRGLVSNLSAAFAGPGQGILLRMVPELNLDRLEPGNDKA